MRKLIKKQKKKMLVVIDPFKTEVNCNFDKGESFYKGTVLLCGWGVTTSQNLVLSTGLITLIGHHKEIRNLTFRSSVFQSLDGI